MPKIRRFGKRSFPKILRLEMISSVVSYKRKNISFHKKMKNLRKIIFNNVFCNRIYPYSRLLPIFKK